MTVVDPRASTPVPTGRGRWRLTLHRRAFSQPLSASDTGIAELVDARGRQLVQQWNQPASFTFTLDGHSQAAALIQELGTDVIAWRWNETLGYDQQVFRGIIAQSEDQITEQSHTVTFTAHDYLAVLSRRFYASATAQIWTALDQDWVAIYILAWAVNPPAATNANPGVPLPPSDPAHPFTTGAFLPIGVSWRNPDGTYRSTASGVLRDRTYFGGQNWGTALSDLAATIGGFDFDAYPTTDANHPAGPGYPAGIDALRVFYPQQGISRTDMALVYGSNVSALTRTVSSDNYANYTRALGNNSNSDPTAAQLYSNSWNVDANNVTVNPVGLWMLTDDAADVTLQPTLDQKSLGDLAYNGTLIPTYTLTLRPNTYQMGSPNMGDTVPLVVNSGRLNVNTAVRVVGITYDIGDDGQEDVSLTVGRPVVGLTTLLSGRPDIDALTRR